MITIHCDDYGYDQQTDKKILDLIKKGKIRSISVLSSMVSKKSMEELKNIVSLRAKRSNLSSSIKVSLHLNLVEKNMYKNLFGFVFAVLNKQIEVNQVEKEVRSQLSVLEKAGIRISSIDSHQHTHAVSPVAEIVQKIADEKNLSIRNYSDVKSITSIAKLKYYFLKSVAFISYVIWNQKFGLPISWDNVIARIPMSHRETKQSHTFMSWEGNSLDVAQIKAENVVAITHPYMPFDSNTSYMRNLENR